MRETRVTKQTETFARRAREERMSAGLSQSALAERVTELIGRSIDHSALAKLERHQRRASLDEALAIAEILDVPLAALLDDPEPTVVDAAAWAAGERGEAAVDLVPRLADLAVTAEDALVRESCIAALGAIGDPRGLPAVLAGCRDKPAVRRRAVLALAPFDGPEVEAALAAALEDRDWQVRQAAEDVTPVHTPGHED